MKVLQVVLVGGFPRPVGGVTTFVRRLAASDPRVAEVVDMYPGDRKDVPAGFQGEYHRMNGVGRGFLYLVLRMRARRGAWIHFNFSSLTSILFFTLLPKGDDPWILMLHHGVLHSRVPDFVVRILLRRFDRIVCLNAGQRASYLAFGVSPGALVEASSYVRPPVPRPDQSFQQTIDAYVAVRPTFVSSGFPRALYHLDWCIRFVRERPEYQLALFLYGEGAERATLERLAREAGNVRVFWDESEDNFNYALSRCAHYLRLTLRDSLGIAVSDAVNYGVPVLATNVCPRPRGVRTFTPDRYESFAQALIGSLQAGVAAETSAEPALYPPFSYDLVA